LDNQVLLSEGSVLTTESIEALFSTKRDISHETCSLLKYSSVKRDLKKFIGNPPYKTIFFDDKQIAEILEMMQAVHLILPLSESLDYFKEHDFYTYHHVLMVFALSIMVAKNIIPDYEDHVHLAATGCIHDIGKTCVPMDVLKKKTPLNKR
jgi:HD-GYP domain-containing protein (c-di-GMP phosphodiesterase class II)